MRKIIKFFVITLLLFVLLVSFVFSQRLPLESENPYYTGFVRWLNVSHTENGTLKSTLNITFFDFNVTNNLIILGSLNLQGKLNITGNTSIAQDTLFVDNTSNRVGIGTASPIYTLEVAGDVNISGGLNVSGSTTFRTKTDSINGFQVLDANGGLPVLNVDTTNERVGIGTSSPIKELHLVGGAISLRLSDSDASTDQDVNAGIEFYRGDNLNRVGFLAFASDSNDIFAIATDYTAGEISLKTGDNSEAIRIDSNQNVGIGTEDPTVNLVVVGDVNITGTLNVTRLLIKEPPVECPANSFITYFNGTTSICVTEANNSLWNRSGNNIFNSDFDGNVGIGVTNPAFKLVVAGNANVTGDLIVGADGSGSIGIGISNPSGTFQSAVSTIDNQAFFDTYSIGGGNSRFVFRKSDTDTIGANAATDDGDVLGAFQFRGNTGGGFVLGARFFAQQDGAMGTQTPSRLHIEANRGNGNVVNHLVLDTQGFIGIQTKTPVGALSVQNISIGNTYFDTNAPPLNGVIIEGNVGIGTASPATLLEVNGNSTFFGNVTIGDGITNTNFTMFSPDGTVFRCGPNNAGTFECS